GFAPEWRARFGAAHAMAAVETGDADAARELLAYVFSQPNVSAPDQLTARLVQARLFELDQNPDRALAIYRAVARAPLDGVATPARLGVIKLEMAKGTLKADAAAAQLEALKWRWRGDATELAVIRTLGELYLSQGPERALGIDRGVARGPLEGVAAPARLGVIKLEMAKGTLKADAAAAQREALKWRWRGDATELAVIRTLGELYLSQGRYREALTTLKTAGPKIVKIGRAHV